MEMWQASEDSRGRRRHSRGSRTRIWHRKVGRRRRQRQTQFSLRLSFGVVVGQAKLSHLVSHFAGVPKDWISSGKTLFLSGFLTRFMGSAVRFGGEGRWGGGGGGGGCARGGRVPPSGVSVGRGVWGTHN